MAYFHGYIQIFAVADPDIPFREGGGGGHEMRLNAKGTVRSCLFCLFVCCCLFLFFCFFGGGAKINI